MSSIPISSNLTTCPRRDVVGLSACIAAACFILCLSWFKIDSLDTGYHLAYGGHFLDHHKIVDRDPFIYPENAVPFVNANWASQIIMALAWRAAGPAGLIAFRVGLISIIFACITIAVRRYTSGLLWLAAAWLMAGAGGYERFSMRPELFSYAIMSLLLVNLLRGVSTGWRMFVIGLLQFLWVNLHSYFLVGILLTGAWWAGSLFDWARTREAKSVLSVRALTIALALQIGVCFVNPWTYRGVLFPVQTLSYLSRENVMGQTSEQTGQNAWGLISEFHSPFRYAGELISGRTIDAYWILLVVAAIGVACNAAQARIGPGLALLLLTAMSFQMRRNIAQFAVAGAPLAVGAIGMTVSRIAAHATTVRVLKSLTAVALSALAIWWSAGIISGRFYFDERRITRQFGSGLSERTFAEPAVRWMSAQGDLQPNLFVDYFSSSNTLLWLPPRFTLFVDTNTFAYAEDTLGAAFDVGLGKIDHEGLFDRNKINVVLLHCGPDTQALVRRLVVDYTNWAFVYFDRQAVVFVRRIPEHVAVILGNHPSPADFNAAGWIASNGEPPFAAALSLGSAVNVPISLGWYSPAAQILDEALKLAPNYHDAWYLLGICHANLGNAEARARNMANARKHYQQALNCAKRTLELTSDHQQSLALRHDMEQVLQAMPQR